VSWTFFFQCWVLFACGYFCGRLLECIKLDCQLKFIIKKEFSNVIKENFEKNIEDFK